MKLLTGEFKNTLDDKGRVSIPARLREGLSESTLVLTKGIQNCVWLLPPDQWEKVSATLMKSASLSTKESNNIRHRFITPSQEGEIDKAGRIAIPQTLRDHARLSKDCLILGVGTSIEIWDAEQYQAYQNSIEANLDDVLDKMSSADLFG